MASRGSRVATLARPMPMPDAADRLSRWAGLAHLMPADADLPNLWPEAIFLAKRGCPLSFTLETPSSGPLEDRIAAHVAAVKAAHTSCS